MVGGPGVVVITFADGAQEFYVNATWETQPGWLWLMRWEEGPLGGLDRMECFPAHLVRSVTVNVA
jgi:hypothetical protein